MLKIKRMLITFAAIAFALAANAASMNLGFCNGRIASEGISKVGNARIEAAVILPGSLLKQYAGAKVTGVRIGLVTAEGITSVEGWIRNSLNEDNLDYGAVATPQAGWNTASLSKGVTIDGSPLAVGFSFSQEKGVKCISLVGESFDDGRWIGKNGKWEISKSKGVVSVELIVSGDNIPETDLAISGLTGDMMPVASGNDLQFSIDVINPSNDVIDGFDIIYSIDGDRPVTSHCGTTLNYGETASVEFTVSNASLSPDVAHTMVVEAVCEADGRPENNRRTLKIGTYTDSWERRVLIEEFTTENCGNCPRAINTLHQCENAGYGDRMNIVAHHAGYGKDWLTQPEDVEYTWFYDPSGESGTFAPAVMLDRTILENQSFPVNSIGYFDTFEPVLKNSLAAPAFVDVSAVASFVDGAIEISVDVERMPIFEVITEHPCLSVYVIEDKIPHRDQAGITSDSFTHSHVFRTCASEVFGTPFDFEDNKAHLEFSVTRRQEWTMENIKIVAFVHDYDSEDIGNCRVYNSVSTSAIPSGVGLPDIESESMTEYFTLSGIKIGEPSEGEICIKRTIHKSGHIIIEKVRI